MHTYPDQQLISEHFALHKTCQNDLSEFKERYRDTWDEFSRSVYTSRRSPTVVATRETELNLITSIIGNLVDIGAEM